MDIATVVGLVLGFALMFGTMVIDSQLAVFIDIPSILFVFGSTFAMLLVSFPLQEVMKFFHYIFHAFFAPNYEKRSDNAEFQFTKQDQIELIKMKRGALILSKTKVYVITSGIIGSFIGWIQLLIYFDQDLDISLQAIVKPSTNNLYNINLNNILADSWILPYISVNILPIFYGLILAFMFCYPLQCKLEYHAAQLEELKNNSS